jgi:hypothetical protein
LLNLAAPLQLDLAALPELDLAAQSESLDLATPLESFDPAAPSSDPAAPSSDLDQAKSPSLDPDLAKLSLSTDLESNVLKLFATPQFQFFIIS